MYVYSIQTLRICRLSVWGVVRVTVHRIIVYIRILYLLYIIWTLHCVTMYTSMYIMVLHPPTPYSS